MAHPAGHCRRNHSYRYRAGRCLKRAGRRFGYLSIRRQFDALQGPEDRPPWVVPSMLSGLAQPGGQVVGIGDDLAQPPGVGGWPVLLSNHHAIRCYGPEPGKWCRWSRAMDILSFPAILRRSAAACPKGQRGAARLLSGCLFTQVAGLTDPGDCRRWQGSGWSDGWGCIGHDGPETRSCAQPAAARRR